MWNYTGKKRPDFAIQPKDGQESVWDYPRPPKVESCQREVIVVFDGRELARSRAALRVLETASPPTIYVPVIDVEMTQLTETTQQTFCEWKGIAHYLVLKTRPASPPVAWFYRSPNQAFSVLSDHVAFYPGRVDCFLDDEPVRPQHSEFYGGWITDDIVGPCKGDPGTQGW